MKLNQQENCETIFFILEPSCESDIPVHVAFDDADAAKAYLNRFRTYSDGQIVKCRLNPGFYTNITKDCFFVQLNWQNDVYVISLVNDLERSELAVNGHYFFEEEQICVYVMAVSEKEALQTAQKIRDKAFACKEFKPKAFVQASKKLIYSN
ncbi:hypothetical protein [Pedobacter nyackensis]|uniref:hypothetical protein n=1 Tax=Pedobacter nyackensis TaxID=475255 RepID=UPI00292EAF85|nr:hypothetical protein [Pedobacter nyackensis]